MAKGSMVLGPTPPFPLRLSIPGALPIKEEARTEDVRSDGDAAKRGLSRHPVRQQLCPAAGAVFRAASADTRGGAAADPPERQPGPRIGSFARRPENAGRGGGAGRKPHSRRRRTAGHGLCRAPVRKFRAATGRRPRHSSGRSDRPAGTAARHSVERQRADPVFTAGRWPGRAGPGVARIYRQRGDGGPWHPDHADIGRGGKRRNGAA